MSVIAMVATPYGQLVRKPVALISATLLLVLAHGLSALADDFGLSVLAISRKNKNILMPLSSMKLQAGDRLIVEGKQEDVNLLRAIQDLKIENFELSSLDQLESEDVGLVEVVLSPRSNLTVT